MYPNKACLGCKIKGISMLFREIDKKEEGEGVMKEKIQDRMAYLEDFIEKKEKELEKMPQDVINVCRHGNRVQYYKKNVLTGERKYIKKKDVKTISRLCQKDYIKKLILVAEKEIKYLKEIQDEYPQIVCEDIYNHLSQDRRPFVTPITLPDEEFIVKWRRQEYVPKGFASDAPEYYTDNGERVRSKSEILIANALKKHNIPYKYEAPLYVNGFGTIHPDFTVLNVKERKEYYWEHMGRMDDPDYVEKALQRIALYEKNDIFPGDKLLLSH